MARRITYKSARNKGSNFERELAKALCKLGINAKRVPMSGGGAIKGDVIELGTSPQHLHEAKNHQALSLNTWWEQTVEQCTNGELPVLHFTSNYKPIYTMITSDLFDDLSFAYEDTRKPINLNLVDYPNRKNFWNFTKDAGRLDVFLYPGDRVVLLFEVYLLLRKAQLSSLSTTAASNTTPAEMANQ